MTNDRDAFDPKLDAMLRDHSTEMPSRELDASILAAAHRAVRSAPRAAEATSPWRWWMPLAAAATIGAITIGVFQLLPKEQPDATTSTIVSDTPLARSPAPTTIPPPAAVAPAEKNRLEPPRAPSSEAPQSQVPQSQVPQGQVPQSEAPRAKLRADRAAQPLAENREAQRFAPPEPFPGQRGDATSRDSAASAPSVAEAESKPQSAQQENAAGTLMHREAPQASAPAVAKQSAASAGAAAVADPAQWIARIRALLAEGKNEEAARELGSFRAAYPDADARLPAELQSCAATVKR